MDKNTGTRIKRVAVGAAVLGAFAAGAAAMANKKKLKAMVRKGAIQAKAAIRKAGKGARARVGSLGAEIASR